MSPVFRRGFLSLEFNLTRGKMFIFLKTFQNIALTIKVNLSVAFNILDTHVFFRFIEVSKTVIYVFNRLCSYSFFLWGSTVKNLKKRRWTEH